jgi:hypothetical protein
MGSRVGVGNIVPYLLTRASPESIWRCLERHSRSLWPLRLHQLQVMSPGQEIRPVGQRPPGLFVDFRHFDEVVDLGELMLGRWRRAFVTGFSRESYACSLKCLALFCVQI